MGDEAEPLPPDELPPDDAHAATASVTLHKMAPLTTTELTLDLDICRLFLLVVGFAAAAGYWISGLLRGPDFELIHKRSFTLNGSLRSEQERRKTFKLG
jgi:hypothetical protein